jgi:uncharacterized SAM-binding protein YcdF (DUF218 family)
MPSETPQDQAMERRASLEETATGTALVIEPSALALAQVLWDFLRMGGPLEKADCILAMGSHDTRVAGRAAELYLEGWAPLLVFSGGLGRLTRHLWDEPEASKFARIAIRMGVPPESIRTETHSTNTGENVRFTHELLASRGIAPSRLILVHKPYMERRAFATFMKQWPEVDVRVVTTSPQIPFEDYPNDEIPAERLIHIMVGDLQRMRTYAERGFQIAQDVPADVWRAYEELVSLGFTGGLASS